MGEKNKLRDHNTMVEYIYIGYISFSLQWVALLLAKEEDTKEVNKVKVFKDYFE